MSFKRNQVEEALLAALRQGRAEMGADVRIRSKRLLETDRNLGREACEGQLVPYAFYSGEPPGRGVEVWFSSYEAFALLLGFFLMEHRWSQSMAARIMRQARPTLEPEHAGILARDPAELFDSEALQAQVAPGRSVAGSTDPLFLAVVSSARPNRLEGEARPMAMRVCPGEAPLMQFFRQRAPAGASMTVLELTAPAHVLAHHLARTKPRARGRGAG